jgi:hypothetical protein
MNLQMLKADSWRVGILSVIVQVLYLDYGLLVLKGGTRREDAPS